MGMCAVLYNKVFKLIDFLFSAYCLIGRLRSLFLLSFVFKILKHYIILLTLKIQIKHVRANLHTVHGCFQQAFLLK